MIADVEQTAMPENERRLWVCIALRHRRMVVGVLLVDVGQKPQKKIFVLNGIDTEEVY